MKEKKQTTIELRQKHHNVLTKACDSRQAPPSDPSRPLVMFAQDMLKHSDMHVDDFLRAFEVGD